MNNLNGLEIISPCHQCGGKAELNIPPYADDYVMVMCLDCECMGDGFQVGAHDQGVDQAIESWNHEMTITETQDCQRIKNDNN